MTLHKLRKAIVDIIYPNRCPFCSSEIKSGEYFCMDCADKLAAPPVFDENISPLCGLEIVTLYDETAKKLVNEFKNNNNGYAINATAYLIYKRLYDKGVLDYISVITAVPMHKKDRRARGYNQSELIAKEISYITGKPYRNLLRKTRLNLPQKSLNEAERRVNVVGVYSYINEKFLLNERVLLIDDVCTTGSTLKESASQLIIGGASRVYAAVLAKTENKS